MTERGDDSSLLDVELVRVRLPLVRVHAAAHGREVDRDLVLVRAVLADGSEGWGECAALSRPTYTGEHTAGAWAVLRDELAPARLADRESTVVGHPMASAAMVGALADAHLRRVGRSLALQLAADRRTALPISAVIGLDGSTDDRVRQAARFVDEGVALVKLKATPEDLEAVGAVRSTFPDLALAVDFNGTADLASLRAVERFGLAYVEQPSPPDALVASAHLAARTDVPIALDESITGPGTLSSAIALGAGSIINVKPGRVGGPFVAAHLVADAVDAGLQAFVGGMLESGIGRAAAVAVAAHPGCTLPTDLGPSSRYFAPDLTDPIEVDEQGHLVVPDGPGTGRRPDPARIDATAVDRLLLSR